MYEEVLREIGLSLNEARVYESLLELNEASVQGISLVSKVHRRNVYDSLAKLMEKGLVSEVFVKGEKNFKPIHPSRLVSLLKEKEGRLAKIMPQMEQQFGLEQEKEEAYIYRGIEGVKNYLQDIADIGETVYFIGAKALWLDPRLEHFLPRFDRERKAAGVTYKHIFDHEVKVKKPEILKLVGKPYKFLPKEYSSPTCIDIFGPYVVSFLGVAPGQLPDEPVLFVMKSRRLADGYRKFWQYMWDHGSEEGI